MYEILWMSEIGNVVAARIWYANIARWWIWRKTIRGREVLEFPFLTTTNKLFLKHLQEILAESQRSYPSFVFLRGGIRTE